MVHAMVGYTLVTMVGYMLVTMTGCPMRKHLKSKVGVSVVMVEMLVVVVSAMWEVQMLQ